MKKLSILMATLILNACASNTQSPNVGTPNPASVFCEQQGGKSVIRKDQTGAEYGVCVLPDGKEVEEWAFFRANSPK